MNFDPDHMDLRLQVDHDSHDEPASGVVESPQVWRAPEFFYRSAAVAGWS